LAIGAVIALKCAAVEDGRQWPQVTANFGSLIAGDKAQIMAMDMGASLDGPKRLADDGPKFADALACVQPPQGDLVSSGDHLSRTKIANSQCLAYPHLCQGNRDIIGFC
jgi:hypothetical protein